jgi:hypothetical protein
MTLQEIAIIPLNKASLCADLECNTISNRVRCPVCGSTTLPLHRIVNETLRDIVQLAPAIA